MPLTLYILNKEGIEIGRFKVCMDCMNLLNLNRFFIFPFKILSEINTLLVYCEMKGWRVYKKNKNKNYSFCYSNDLQKKVNLLKSIAKLDFVASTESKYIDLKLALSTNYCII